MTDFKPDRYTPEQAVRKFVELGNDYDSSVFWVHISRQNNEWGVNATNKWQANIDDGILKPQSILHPNNFNPEGLVFNHISVASLSISDGSSRIETHELMFEKGELKIPEIVRKDLDQLAEAYVNCGFIEKQSDMGLVVAAHSRSENVMFFVTLPAEKISFKKAMDLKEQSKNYAKIEDLLENILDDNIKLENGTIKMIRPESPTSPLFARLLLDKDHYEIFSKLKNAKDYTVHQIIEEGDYPPSGLHRAMLRTASTIGGFIDGELKMVEKGSYGKQANSQETELLKNGFKKLLGLQDGISVVEVILDGRELSKLKDDLIDLKEERKALLVNKYKGRSNSNERE
jgi:hypothetical protein